MDINVHNIELKVHLAYDPDASVWYVAQSDIPGLRLEADDPSALVRRIMDAAPELIEMNCEEIRRLHDRDNWQKQRPEVALLPVFDSPLQLAHA